MANLTAANSLTGLTNQLLGNALNAVSGGGAGGADGTGGAGGAAGVGGAGGAGSTLQNFQNVLSNAMGPQVAQSFEQAVQGAANTTSLRPADGAQAKTPLYGGMGSDGSVRDLSQAGSQAVSGRLKAVETSQQDAEQKMQTLLSGGDVDLHTVVLAAERAQLELQLTMHLRNKLLEAYQEIMRMPV